MNAIAIITARGGSKRIPRKNIRPFLGRPMLHYSIEAAKESGLFDEVMVSTDDLEIAKVGEAAGARVPFMRSAKAADDFATTADVIEEVLAMYAEKGKHFDYFCCLYPAAPFTTAQKLRQAWDMLSSSDADAVVPVATYGVPVWWAMERDAENRISFLWPEHQLTRSQDLLKAWYDVGQFYFFRTEPFLQKRQMFTDKTLGLEVSELEVQDIDNEPDWVIAEMKYKASVMSAFLNT